MPPGPTAHDLADVLSRYSVASAQLRVALTVRGSPPNGHHLVVRKLDATSHLASRRCCAASPAFRDAVLLVVHIGADPQMLWIEARWVVAGMAHHESRRDRADPCFIRNPVHSAPAPFDADLAIAADPKSGVLPAAGLLHDEPSLKQAFRYGTRTRINHDQ